MSPHPYRLAMSCLDTPPATLDPPRRRHLPIEALMLACGIVAAVTGLLTLHAVGHGGHVEIAPAAIAHARRAPIQRRQPTQPRARIEEPKPVAQTPLLRGGTHDPKTLLAVARQLQSVGLDLTVLEVEIAHPPTPFGDQHMWPMLVPLRGQNNRLESLELHGLSPASQFAAAGLANGDRILTIDGYDIDDAIDAIDFGRPQKLGRLIVEIARGVHHVVLSIRWPVP